MPPFNENIPQANQTIASSQSPILQNFQAIKQLIDVNHGTFGGSGVNAEGKHKFVEMPNQSVTPTTAAGEMTLYSAQYTKTSQSEAYIIRDAAGTPIPFSAASLAASGWTFLPSGILVKWGQAAFSAPANSTQSLVITFPAGATIPAFTSVWNAQISLQNNAMIGGVTLGAYIQSLSTTAMTVEVGTSQGSTQNGNVYYVLIGQGTP